MGVEFQRFSFLFVFLFFCGMASAEDIQIAEDLFGEPSSTPSEAAANFQTLCENWEKAAKELGGNHLYYTSCGSAPDRISMAYGDSNTLSNIFAYSENSVGKMLVITKEPFGVLTEWLSGEETSCNPQQRYLCLDATRRAVLSHRTACKKFQEKAKKSLGARFLYASCGVGQSDYAKNPAKIRVRTQAKLFFVK